MDLSEYFKFDLFFIMLLENNIWHPLFQIPIETDTIFIETKSQNEKVDGTIVDDQRWLQKMATISLQSHIQNIDAQKLWEGVNCCSVRAYLERTLSEECAQNKFEEN